MLLNERSATRLRLAKISGFSLLTVSKFVNTFIEDGIVVELGSAENTGGRKAGVLSLNSKYAYALAVDIGASKVRIGVVSINGTVIEQEETSYYKGVIPVDSITLEELSARLAKLLDKYERNNVMGIGIGFSGIVNSAEGQIVFSPNIANYNNLSLAKQLERVFDLPVALNTSARCMALAEQRFGVGHNVDNQVFVSVGFSISAGIIINSHLFSGGLGFSGEIGHLPVSGQKTQCSCGNFDCVETYATLPNIKARIQERIRNTEVYSIARSLAPPTGDIDISIMQQALELGDKIVSSVIVQVGEELGDVLVGVTNTLNPEIIVLGGGVIEVFPSLIDEVNRVVRQKSLTTNHQYMKILKSTLGFDCGLIGSATQIINNFFET